MDPVMPNGKRSILGRRGDWLAINFPRLPTIFWPITDNARTQTHLTAIEMGLLNTFMSSERSVLTLDSNLSISLSTSYRKASQVSFFT